MEDVLSTTVESVHSIFTAWLARKQNIATDIMRGTGNPTMACLSMGLLPVVCSKRIRNTQQGGTIAAKRGD